MLRSALIISTLVLPTFAWGQCPTITDLDAGITVTFADGSFDSFKTGADGAIVNVGSRIIEGEQYEWTIQKVAGVFDTHVFERTKGYWHPTSDFVLEYNFDIAAAPPFEAGAVGGGLQTLREEGFTEVATYSYSVHDSDGFTIKDCSFAALEIYQTNLLPTGDLGISRSIYLTELGISLIIERNWTNGTPEIYQPVSIAANS